MEVLAPRKIYIVPKFSYGSEIGGLKNAGWKVVPGVAQLDGARKVEFKFLGKGYRTFVIDLGEYFEPPRLDETSHPLSARVLAEEGSYLEYEVWVDGQPAEGGSAPGMIVD
jgi:hypothetical protein